MTTHSILHWMDALEPLFEPSISSRNVAKTIVALADTSQTTPLHNAIKPFCSAQIVPASSNDHEFPEVEVAATCVVRFVPIQPEHQQTVWTLTKILSVALRGARAREVRERQWMTDALTGVYRRDAMDDVLRHQIEHAGVVVCFDLIGFKAVNDAYGHVAGDRLLREFADMLRTFFRASDLIFRFGGDEFVVLCPDANADQLGHRMTTLRAQVQSHHHRLDVRIGLAPYMQFEALSEAIETADRAMYSGQ
jgi:diguanylate cyclase (GGDEF)-like protein